MTSASSARQLGDEIHQYLFWQFGGRMLAQRQIAAVGFETGEFTAFDDIGVKFAKPRPDGLGYFDEDHIQSKFSVAGGKVLTGEGLTDPRLINATTFSLLERLRDAVDQAEKEGRRCTFTLLSPWPIEQGSLLANYRSYVNAGLVPHLADRGVPGHNVLANLLANGDPFELPDFPGVTSPRYTIVHSETRETFKHWTSGKDWYGTAELVTVDPPRHKTVVLRRFFNRQGGELLAYPSCLGVRLSTLWRVIMGGDPNGDAQRNCSLQSGATFHVVEACSPALDVSPSVTADRQARLAGPA